MRTTSLLFVLITIAIAACNTADKTTTPGPDSSKGVDTTKWPKHLPEGKIKGMNYFDYPIADTLAQECVNKYKEIYHGSYNEEQVKAAFTEFVAFDSRKVQEWLDTYKVLDNSEYLDIRFGVYTKHVIETLNGDSDQDNNIDPHKEGRLTIFIWPMMNDGIAGRRTATYNGVKINPFNIGSLHP